MLGTPGPLKAMYMALCGFICNLLNYSYSGILYIVFDNDLSLVLNFNNNVSLLSSLVFKTVN